MAAQRTADAASIGEMVAAYFPQLLQDKPNSEEAMWKILCEMVQELREPARRIESQADATRSRAEAAQKEARWANGRARGAQTQLDLATRGQRTIDHIEWQLADFQLRHPQGT